MAIEPAINCPINCGLAMSTITNIFAKKSISERSFELISTPIERVLSSASESIVQIDKNNDTIGTPLKIISRKSNTSYVTDILTYVNILSTNYFQKIKIVSDSPTIATAPGIDGLSVYQSNGTCILRGVADDGETYLTAIPVTSASLVNVDTFISWANGSLAKHCTDQIDGLISNKTELNIYTDYQFYGNHITNTFQRNPNCWANGVDLSCVSPWNITAPGDEDGGGAIKAGTLISRRHVLFCKHASFYPKVGAQMIFISPNNERVYRTIINNADVPNADMNIGLLDSEVPNNISHAKVLPANYLNYLPPSLTPNSTVPVLCLNQTERASISALFSFNLEFKNIYPTAYPNYYERLIKNDSGNPCFLIINGEPVLLGVWTGGGAGSGDNISDQFAFSSVNNTMNSLIGGYQLTTIDLSQFNNYG